MEKTERRRKETILSITEHIDCGIDAFDSGLFDRDHEIRTGESM